MTPFIGVAGYSTATGSDERRTMSTHKEEIHESLTRQLHAWELLEVELTARLADDPDSQQLLQALSGDETRKQLLEQLAKADPNNSYLRAYREPLDMIRYEQMTQELERALERLEADPDLAKEVKVARQGAEAVTLGPELAVVADLVQNLALIAMPVAVILAARVKRVGDVEFYEGIPQHLTDVVKGLKGFLPGFNVSSSDTQD